MAVHRTGSSALFRLPEKVGKLVIQTETAEAMQGVVRHLGGEHEVERIMDGYCRFSLVADKVRLHKRCAGWSSEIDYGRFIESVILTLG